MDTYPRFNVFHPIKFRPERERLAYRVSAAEARRLTVLARPLAYIEDAPRPRFRIKVAKWDTPSPILLRDRSRPAFLGRYATVEAAARAMDNIVRRELGHPERIGLLPSWERGELHAPPVTQIPCQVVPIFPAEYVEEGINR